jgi:hypothetical protein
LSAFNPSGKSKPHFNKKNSIGLDNISKTSPMKNLQTLPFIPKSEEKYSQIYLLSKADQKQELALTEFL